MSSTRIGAAFLLFALVGLVAYPRWEEVRAMRETTNAAAPVYTTRDEADGLPNGDRRLKTQWHRTLTAEVFRFHRLEHIKSPRSSSPDVWHFKFRYLGPTTLAFYHYSLRGHAFMSGYGNFLDTSDEGPVFWEYRKEVDGEWRVENSLRRNGAIDVNFVREADDKQSWRELQRDQEYDLSFALGWIEPDSRVRIGMFTKAGVFWSEPFTVPRPRSIILSYPRDDADDEEL